MHRKFPTTYFHKAHNNAILYRTETSAIVKLNTNKATTQKVKMQFTAQNEIIK